MISLTASARSRYITKSEVTVLTSTQLAAEVVAIDKFEKDLERLVISRPSSAQPKAFADARSFQCATHESDAGFLSGFQGEGVPAQQQFGDSFCFDAR